MNKVLKTILSIILTSVLLLVGCSVGSQSLGVRVGELAPDFQLQNLDGQATSLSYIRGRPVMLNFWATWCGPCRHEMPYLQQIHEEWSGIVLLTINIGESPARVREFLQTNNLSMPVLLDTTSDVAQKYDITGIPTTFFIDKDGIIQEKIVGSFPNKEAIEQHLGKIIP